MRTSRTTIARPCRTAKHRQARAVLCGLSILASFCIAPGVQAQAISSKGTGAAGQAQAGPSPSSPTPPSQGFLEYKQGLAEERQVLEAQAERHFSRLDKFLDRVIWGLGILSAVALTLLAWFFGTTRREMRENIQGFVESHGRDIFEGLLKPYKQRIQELDREVQILRSYQDRKIVWIMDAEINSQLEAEALRSSGFRNIELRIPSEDGPLNIGKCNLVILSFNGLSESLVRLSLIIDEISKISPPIPLLVYTFNPKGKEVKLDTPALSILKRYPWAMTVNYPLTLMTSIQSLLRVGDMPGVTPSVRL